MSFENWNENLDWDNKFKFFQVFIEKENRMPDRSRESENKLYNWIYAQKQNTADKKRFEKISNFLEEKNISLSKRKSWDNVFDILEEYIKTNKELPKQGQNVNGIILYSWINNQMSKSQTDSTKKEKINLLLQNNNITRNSVERTTSDPWVEYFSHYKSFLNNKIPIRYSKDENFKEWTNKLKRRWFDTENNGINKLSKARYQELKDIDFSNLIMDDMMEYENLKKFAKECPNLECLEVGISDIENDTSSDTIDRELNIDITFNDMDNFEMFCNSFKNKYFMNENIVKLIKRERNKWKSGKIISEKKIEVLHLFNHLNLSLTSWEKKIKEKVLREFDFQVSCYENQKNIEELWDEAINNVYQKNKNDTILKFKSIGKKNLAEFGSENNISRERSRQLFEEIMSEFEKILKLKINKFVRLDKRENKVTVNTRKSEIILGSNTILYGATGTGKSFLLDNITTKKTFRCMFHEEYSYFDFIGQYKPVMYTLDKNSKNFLYDEFDNVISNDREPIIVYSFVAGDFLKAYVEAYKNPNDEVFFIIEEINRGNTSAIFGDIFQLLDRNKNGVSKYPVTPSRELSKYLKEQGIPNFSELKIPNNLTIVSTMNTADQSLFFIDAAFKRRWDLKYVPINYEENSLINVEIENTNIKWLDFIKKTNSIIVEKMESENKCIGQWFIKEKENKIQESDIKNKLLHYLFFDVFQHDRLEIFKTVEFSKLYNKNMQELIEEIFSL